ncbi:MAG TPA: zinc ABC transporter substrate-binding protein [Spirochaetota bacterium]|jgi:zinc transport system substrate-binding protein|nr:zinc ABC transporter substrate-binding protein [Spirochaetota bacterium]
MKYLKSLFSIIFLLFIFSCGSKDDSQKNKLTVVVTILPQKYLVDRISGGRVNCFVLVCEGQNPHSYEPTAKQISEISQSKIWFLSGVDMEIALKDKIASISRGLMIVDITEGVNFRRTDAHEHEEAENEHHHNSTDADKHIWLGREPLKIMSRSILQTLVSLDSNSKDFYEENYKKLITDIDSVFEELKIKLAPLKGRKVFVYHPAFGYFCDDFDIKQVAIETGGKEPDAPSIAKLIKLAKDEGAIAFFVQKQFPSLAAKKIAQSIGAEVVMLDPLSYDLIDNLKLMGEALAKYANKGK